MDRIDSDFLQMFLHLHFITTSLNNRRQLNDNDLRPNSLCQARSKVFSWKLRAYYGYLRENIYDYSNMHNLQMLFML